VTLKVFILAALIQVSWGASAESGEFIRAKEAHDKTKRLYEEKSTLRDANKTKLEQHRRTRSATKGRRKTSLDGSGDAQKALEEAQLQRTLINQERDVVEAKAAFERADAEYQHQLRLRQQEQDQIKEAEKQKQDRIKEAEKQKQDRIKQEALNETIARLKKVAKVKTAKKEFRDHLNNDQKPFTDYQAAVENDVKERWTTTHPGQYIWDTQNSMMLQVHGLIQRFNKATQKCEYLYEVRQLGTTVSTGLEPAHNHQLLHTGYFRTEDSHTVLEDRQSPHKIIEAMEWNESWRFSNKTLVVELCHAAQRVKPWFEPHAEEQWETTLGAPEQEKVDTEAFMLYNGKMELPTVSLMDNNGLMEWVKYESQQEAAKEQSLSTQKSAKNRKALKKIKKKIKVFTKSLNVIKANKKIDGNTLIEWSKNNSLKENGFQGKYKWKDSYRVILKEAVLKVHKQQLSIDRFDVNGLAAPSMQQQGGGMQRQLSSDELEAGWQSAVDPKSEKMYYVTPDGKTQWDPPTLITDGTDQRSRRRLASRRRLENRPIHRLLREINRAQGQA